MTAKDLHFSLNSALRRPEPPSEKAATTARPQSRPALAQVAGSRAPGRAPRKLRPAVKPGRPWLPVAAIALLNMAFMALAALWLTGSTTPFRAPPVMTNTTSDAAFAPALGELQAAVTDNTTQLSEQLHSLQTALREQGQRLATLQAEVAQLRAAPAPAPAAGNNPAQAAPPANLWHINLGSFSTPQDALELQQRMKALGHAARVQPDRTGSTTEYRVLIDGFGDRESADRTAKAIMEQTNLNGLWVWNGE